MLNSRTVTQNYTKLDNKAQAALEAFREWRSWAENTELWAVLERRKGKTLKIKDIRPTKTQRYFPEGRRRIKAKVMRRLSQYRCGGVHLVLEFDANAYSLSEAWEIAGKEARRFIDAVNKKRRRKFERHMKAAGVQHYKYRPLSYVRVVEEHKSGYPHIHIWFPGLRYLLSVEELRGLWGHGFVFVKRAYTSAAAYVAKYVGKLEGWDELGLAMLWAFHIRLYSTSRDLSRPSPSPPKRWILWLVTDNRYRAIKMIKQLGEFNNWMTRLLHVAFERLGREIEVIRKPRVYQPTLPIPAGLC